MILLKPVTFDEMSKVKESINARAYNVKAIST